MVTGQQFHDQLFHATPAAGSPFLQVRQQLGIQGEIKPLGQLVWIQAETGICLTLRSGPLLIGLFAGIAGWFCPDRHQTFIQGSPFSPFWLGGALITCSRRRSASCRASPRLEASIEAGGRFS